jgi:hypothetical protein
MELQRRAAGTCAQEPHATRCGRLANLWRTLAEPTRETCSNLETAMREPTLADVRSIASHYRLGLSQADAEGHLGWLRTFLQGFTAIDALPDDYPAPL